MRKNGKENNRVFRETGQSHTSATAVNYPNCFLTTAHDVFLWTFPNDKILYNCGQVQVLKLFSAFCFYFHARAKMHTRAVFIFPSQIIGNIITFTFRRDKCFIVNFNWGLHFDSKFNWKKHIKKTN